MRWCHLYSGWILSPGWKLWRQSNEHTQTFISSVILNLLKFTVNMNHSRLQSLPCHACVLHAEYVVFICHSLPLGCMDVPQTWGNGTKWSCTRIFKLQVKTKQNNKTNQTKPKTQQRYISRHSGTYEVKDRAVWTKQRLKKALKKSKGWEFSLRSMKIKNEAGLPVFLSKMCQCKHFMSFSMNLRVYRIY